MSAAAIRKALDTTHIVEACRMELAMRNIAQAKGFKFLHAEVQNALARVTHELAAQAADEGFLG